MNNFNYRFSQIIVILLLFISIPLESMHAAQNEAVYRTKDEVVYGVLTEKGDNEAIYVVNVFEITAPGTITDYGNYSDVKNMSNLSKMTNGDEQVQFEGDKGKFYYQGDLLDEALPWEFSVSYKLNGKQLDPIELLGKNGKVEITIHTKKNEKINPVFYEHYMLQVGLSFDVGRFSNIKAEDATIANAGKMEQVTFTVLPEKDAELTVTALVEDFEMESIEFVAIPFMMAIDDIDTDDMVQDMKLLSDAIAELHKGVAVLNDGLKEFNNGAGSLEDGSRLFLDGLQRLNRASAPLIDGSKQINEALQSIQTELSIFDDIDLTDFEQLVLGLDELIEIIENTGLALQQLANDFQKTYKEIKELAEQIPDDDESLELNDAEWALIREQLSVDKFNYLLSHYEGAKAIKRLFNSKSFNELFRDVEATLEEASAGMLLLAEEMMLAKAEVEKGLSEYGALDDFVDIIDGFRDFSSQYISFHQGLIDYTTGVNELTNNYIEVHRGISEVKEGSKDIYLGSGELYEGTKKLKAETMTLPEEMQDEIDEFLKTYDHSSFTATSFVSPKNESIGLVQFIMKTKEIKHPEEKNDTGQEKEQKSFWKKIKELFTFKK